MKSIGTNMQAHLAGEVTSLATCWKITRSDSTVLGFTDHSKDVVVDGVTYVAETGFTPTAQANSAGLSVDNADIEGVLDASAITEADILAGLYDFAEIQVFQVNYEALEDGRIVLRTGTLGEVTLRNGRFTAEVRGISQPLQQTMGALFSPSCRARFADGRCKVNAASYTVTTSVTAALSRQEFTASALTQASGYFAQGKVVFSSGANAGLSMEVKGFAGGVVTLALPMPYGIAVDDAFSITAGCDKTLSTCISRFSNAINFRGEPHVPGLDRVLETSSTRSSW